MNIHLISAILKSVWAIDGEAALAYSPLLSNLIGTGLKLEFSFEGQEFEPSIISAGPSVQMNRWTNLNDAPEGSVALIPLKGPLMKDDQFCGPSGTSTIGKLIRQADGHKNIDAIVLHIDSPGGTVDGTVALAEIIAGTTKPVVAFADGLMASAALWIGSAANEVIASNNKAQIGSIGVILSFADLEPAYEKLGVKFHRIVADQSKDKIRLFEDVRAGKYEEYRKEVLNPIAEEFISAVKANRPGVKEDQLTGKVYFAEDVVGSLVDSIGNLDFAINRARELAAASKKTEKSTQNPIQMKKQYNNVNSLLGVEQLEASEEGVFLQEEQVASIDAAIEKGSQDAAALTQATADKEKAEADLAAAQATIQEKDAEIAQLKKNAGAEPAKVVAQDDPEPPKAGSGNVTSEEKSFTENLDAIQKDLLG